MAAINVTELDGLGVELSGLDLRALTESEFAMIQAHFSEHGVIFFRDQSLSEADHLDFARRWGDVNVNRFFAALPDFPEIALVAKEPDQTDNIGGGWHTDHSYDHEPALGSILVARELPDAGGDTMFASMYKAYETLDEETKAEIEHLKAVHSGKHIFGTESSTYYQNSDAGNGRIGNPQKADELTDPVHPVVITHPLSGKKALYVNPAFTVRFEHQTKEESEPLLSKLYAHVMKGDFQTRFKWRKGSVAMWDNRSTWHWALNDYQGHRRIMHRVTVEGCALN